MSDVRSEALPGLRITNGDGNPFGTFRMRASAWVARAVAAFGIVLPAALLVDVVRTQAQLGLPWSDGLAGDVLTAGAAGASILVAAYFGLVRPRLEVRSRGIRVVGFFDTLSVAWSDIERFDCGVRLEIHLHRPYVDWEDRDLNKTYVEVEALTVGAPGASWGWGGTDVRRTGSTSWPVGSTPTWRRCAEGTEPAPRCPWTRPRDGGASEPSRWC